MHTLCKCPQISAFIWEPLVCRNITKRRYNCENISKSAFWKATVSECALTNKYLKLDFKMEALFLWDWIDYTEICVTGGKRHGRSKRIIPWKTSLSSSYSNKRCLIFLFPKAISFPFFLPMSGKYTHEEQWDLLFFLKSIFKNTNQN